MKVFVTGHKGYIGAHLIEILKQSKHTVTACDINLFPECQWAPTLSPDQEIIKDIRHLTVQDLQGYDCLMHLAAISNDPMGDINPDLTYSINRDASISLAKKAKEAGIPLFLFASSCSIYGKGKNLILSETDDLAPLSAYAESKIAAEKEIGLLADQSFSPVFLRNATAYGYSPMLRIDLVANNFLSCAIAKGSIRLLSDGTPWRPLIHCKDIARAFVAFMQAPRDLIHNLAVNVGCNAENYQVRDILQHVSKLVPEAQIIYTGEIGTDPRNYRVSFDLLGRILPEFSLHYTLESGMQELHRRFIEKNFNADDFDADRFVRLRLLKKRLMNLEQACN